MEGGGARLMLALSVSEIWNLFAGIIFTLLLWIRTFLWGEGSSSWLALIQGPGVGGGLQGDPLWLNSTSCLWGKTFYLLVGSAGQWVLTELLVGNRGSHCVWLSLDRVSFTCCLQSFLDYFLSPEPPLWYLRNTPAVTPVLTPALSFPAWKALPHHTDTLSLSRLHGCCLLPVSPGHLCHAPRTQGFLSLLGPCWFLAKLVISVSLMKIGQYFLAHIRGTYTSLFHSPLQACTQLTLTSSSMYTAWGQQIPTDGMYRLSKLL